MVRSRTRFLAQSAIILFLTYSSAQEKRVPDSRRIELSPDSALVNNVGRLPKIDVSDFVITGASSIEIPVAEKLSLDLSWVTVATRPAIGERTREKPTLSVRAQNIVHDSKKPLSGKLVFNGGTFLSTDAALWVGRSEPQGRYGMNINYVRSSGYAANTDYARGSIDASGGILLPEELSPFSGADLSGSVFFGGNAYGFYGSIRPMLKRENNVLEFSAMLSQTKKFPFAGGIRFRSFVTHDSAETAERTIALSFAKVLELLDRQLSLHSELTLTEIAGGQSSSYPISQTSVHSQVYDVAPVLVSAGLALYVGRNSKGVSFLRLYPELQTAVQLNATHRFVAAYEPRVQRSTLEQNLQLNPYLLASSEIRHKDISSSGRLAFESSWTGSLSSRVSAIVQSIDDYPFLVDSSSSGWWQNVYAGTVTMTTIRAEMFAKFRSFDYFASSITVDISKNSSTGGKIPYLPEYKFVAEYGKVLGERWKLCVSLTVSGVQETQLAPSATLRGFSQLNLGSSYEFNNVLSAQVSILNLLNQRFERWKGYQEFPLMLQAGVSVNW
jgi:hypothetical protein